jgi:hypothetical protein
LPPVEAAGDSAVTSFEHYNTLALLRTNITAGKKYTRRERGGPNTARPLTPQVPALLYQLAQSPAIYTPPSSSCYGPGFAKKCNNSLPPPTIARKKVSAVNEDIDAWNKKFVKNS